MPDPPRSLAVRSRRSGWVNRRGHDPVRLAARRVAITASIWSASRAEGDNCEARGPRWLTACDCPPEVQPAAASTTTTTRAIATRRGEILTTPRRQPRPSGWPGRRSVLSGAWAVGRPRRAPSALSARAAEVARPHGSVHPRGCRSRVAGTGPCPVPGRASGAGDRRSRADRSPSAIVGPPPAARVVAHPASMTYSTRGRVHRRDSRACHTRYSNVCSRDVREVGAGSGDGCALRARRCPRDRSRTAAGRSAVGQLPLPASKACRWTVRRPLG